MSRSQYPYNLELIAPNLAKRARKVLPDHPQVTFKDVAGAVEVILDLIISKGKVWCDLCHAISISKGRIR